MVEMSTNGQQGVVNCRYFDCNVHRTFKLEVLISRVCVTPMLPSAVFCFILFYFILFDLILFYFILFYFILFYFISFYFILFLWNFGILPSAVELVNLGSIDFVWSLVATLIIKWLIIEHFVII